MNTQGPSSQVMQPSKATSACVRVPAGSRWGGWVRSRTTPIMSPTPRAVSRARLVAFQSINQGVQSKGRRSPQLRAAPAAGQTTGAALDQRPRVAPQQTREPSVTSTTPCQNGSPGRTASQTLAHSADSTGVKYEPAASTARLPRWMPCSQQL